MNLVVKRFEDLTTTELYEILKVRAATFIMEQNIHYLDPDEKDKFSYHVFLEEAGEIKAYLRVLDKGVSFEEVAIGRVLTRERGTGLGHRILKEGIRVAKDLLKAEEVVIESQSYIQKFYEQHGFERISEEFLDEGIPHVKMILKF